MKRSSIMNELITSIMHCISGKQKAVYKYELFQESINMTTFFPLCAASLKCRAAI